MLKTETEEPLLQTDEAKIKTLNPILTGNIWKELLRFSWPLILSSIFQQLYSTADLMIVGKFTGHEAMAAVGSTGSITVLFIGLFLGLSVGASVVYSQYYGAEDQQRLHQTVGTAFWVAMLGGLFLMVAGLIFAKPLLKFMRTPEDILDLATTYMQIVFAGMIPQMMYNISSGIVRAKGDSRTPLKILTLSCIINIVLDLIFVAVFDWSVAGAAWATVISQIVAAIFTMRVIFQTDLLGYRGRETLAFSSHILKQMLKMGVPAGLQTVVISFSNVLLQVNINAFGTAAVAGTAAAVKIDGFIFMLIDAFGIAITTFVAQNIGAGKYKRAMLATRTCLILSCATAIGLGIVGLVFSEQLLSIFNASPEVLYFGKRMMLIICPSYWIFAVFATLSGSFRGEGNAVVPMVIALVCLCLIRLTWVYAMLPSYRHIDIIYLSYPVSWSFAALSIGFLTIRRQIQRSKKPIY